MHHATLTMCLYMLSPAPSPTRPALEANAEADASGEDAAPEDSLIAQLEQANQDADEDPLRTIERLSVPLQAFEAFEELYAHNPRALELRALAQLNLARAQLETGDELAANATIHAAIRDQHGGTLPAERLGPTLTRFYLEQRDLLLSKGRATVSLMYPTPCEFVINGKLVDTRLIELPLGEYRVHVRAADGSAELDEVLDLTKSGEVVVIGPERSPSAVTDAAPEPAVATLADLPPPRTSTHSTRSTNPYIGRELGRAARAKRRGVVLLGVGAGCTVVGGGLVTLGLVSMNASDNLISALGSAGLLLLGASVGVGGIGSLIAGGVFYGVGAARERRARRSAGQYSLISPVLVVDRNSAHVGVSMRF